MRLQRKNNNLAYENPLDMLQLLEAHLFLPQDNTVTTAYVESVIQEVVREFEKETRRNLFVEEYIAYVDYADFKDGGFLKIPDVKEVTEISYIDKDTKTLKYAYPHKYSIRMGDKFVRFIPKDATYIIDVDDSSEAMEIHVRKGMVEVGESVRSLPADIRKAFKQRISYLVQNHGDEMDFRIDPLPYDIEVRAIYSKYKIPLIG